MRKIHGTGRKQNVKWQTNTQLYRNKIKRKRTKQSRQKAEIVRLD